MRFRRARELAHGAWADRLGRARRHTENTAQDQGVQRNQGREGEGGNRKMPGTLPCPEPILGLKFTDAGLAINFRFHDCDGAWPSAQTCYSHFNREQTI